MLITENAQKTKTQTMLPLETNKDKPEREHPPKFVIVQRIGLARYFEYKNKLFYV